MPLTTRTYIPAPSRKSLFGHPRSKRFSTAIGGLKESGNHQQTNQITQLLRKLPVLLSLLLIELVFLAASVPAVGAGLPPAFGKLCGHVRGAAWKYQGQSGREYNVTAKPASSCRIAMRSVSGLTKQTSHFGPLGAQTLSGPKGYRCAGAGSLRAHGGFCGRGASHFLWAPRKR